MAGTDSTETDDNVDLLKETRNVVTGTIDATVEKTGEIASSKSVKQKISQMLEYIRNRKWTNTFRSLSEWLGPSNFSKPGAREIWKRLETNIKYFLTNYIALTLTIFAFTIVTDVWLFVGSLGLGYLWSIALSKETMSIGRLQVTGNRKFGILVIITVLIMLWLGFHETAVFAIAISSLLTFLHAILHKIPQSLSMEDEEDDGFLSLGSNIGQV